MRPKRVSPVTFGPLASWIAAFGLLLGACDDPKTERGRSCASDDDCDELACVARNLGTVEDLGPVPLACDDLRDGRAPHEPCDENDDCDTGICLLAGACARPCVESADCARTEHCAAAYARTDTDALLALHACVNTVDLPDDAEIDVDVRKQVLHGEPDELDTINLPKIDPPTLLVLEHLGENPWPLSETKCRPPLCARALETRDADPIVLFDHEAIDENPEGPLNPIANGNHVSPITVLLPNSPRSELSSAGYRVSLQSETPGDLRITRLHRATRGHRLDLNVFYVGTRELMPGDVAPEFVMDALDEVNDILNQAEIVVGNVRHIEVTGELLERGADLPGVTVAQGFSPIETQYGVCPQLPELWKLSAGASNVAINVFLVSDVAMCGAEGDIHGLSGGTPGPLGMHGTAGSGIVISTDMMVTAGDPLLLGRTIAHELGHYMGLFHTSEADGRVIEPLADTAACAPVHASDDPCMDNLMYPTVDITSTTLTEEQREVLRSAFVLQ